MAALLVGGITAAATSFLVDRELTELRQQTTSHQNEVAAARREVSRLSISTASGGGVIQTSWLALETGQPAPLLEPVFSFDRHHAFLRIDNNQRALAIETFGYGKIAIGPNQFLLSMTATALNEYVIQTMANGNRRVRIRGRIECVTEVDRKAPTHMTIGSGDGVEVGSFEIVAVDAGIGGGKAGDNLTFKVSFDSEESPIHYNLFGPEFEFAGPITLGEIAIVDPAR